MNVIGNKEAVGKLIIRSVVGMLMLVKGVRLFSLGRPAIETIGSVLEVFKVPVNTGLFLAFGCFLVSLYVIGGIAFVAGVLFKTTSFLLGTAMLLEAAFDHFCLHKSLFPTVAYCITVAAVMYGFMLIGTGGHAAQKASGKPSRQRSSEK